MPFQKLFNSLTNICMQMISDATSYQVLEDKTREIVDRIEAELYNEYKQYTDDEYPLEDFIGESDVIHDIGYELLDLWVPALVHMTAYHSSWEKMGDIDIKFQEVIGQYYCEKLQDHNEELATN